MELCNAGHKTTLKIEQTNYSFLKKVTKEI